MRWQGREKSSNVEDRRGMGTTGMVTGGTVGTLVIVLLVWLLGGDPSQVMSSLDSSSANTEYVPTEAEQELADFVSVVLKDTEDVWNVIFTEGGLTYREPTLVLYNNAVQSACGFSSAATGPFYCGGDEKVYIDLSFLTDLQKRLGAHGDFAIAYIIAHEVGHHVQKLLGILEQIQDLNGRVSQEEYNEYMVRLELQADFLAGIWAYHAERTKNILEEGDIEEAVNAAGAVGDDRLQMQSQGYVIPDAFTHGTSEQRKRWLMRGFQSGNIDDGDTFSASSL